MKKYRILAMLGIMALTTGSMLAQDYDDIYYDASKSKAAVKTKVETPAKTVAVYGDVPEKYKVAVQDNYRVERDVDEYNRHVAYEPVYEIDINGDTIYYDNDTIYEEAFANTRRIERFYNPDVVILSDDDDLVELYYDESPTINLIVGSDWTSGSYYGWDYASYYYPWYTGWYDPWYIGFDWYRPWRWHSPWYYGYYSHWHYGYYSPWYYNYWYVPYGGVRPYGWDWDYRANWTRPHTNAGHYSSGNWMHNGRRAGLATNRNTRGRSDGISGNRNSIASRGSDGNRGTVGGGNLSGLATSRGSGGGNMDTRRSGSSGVRTRSSNSSISRSSAGSRSYSGSSSSSYGGGRSSSSSSYGGSSRSYGGSSSSGSRSSGGSYSSGSSHSSSGGGGGSHGGSSGGGGRRR